MSLDKSVQIFETEETQESSAASNASARLLQEVGSQIAATAAKDLTIDKSFPSAGDLLKGLGGTQPLGRLDTGTADSAHSKSALENLNDAQKAHHPLVNSNDASKDIGPLEKLNNNAHGKSEAERVQQGIQNLGEARSKLGNERHQTPSLNNRPGSQIERGAREIQGSIHNRLDNLGQLWKDAGRSQTPRPAERQDVPPIRH